MKHFRTAILTLLLAGVFVACNKDKDDVAFKIEGSWVGKIGQNSDSPTGQYALNIKGNGGVERVSSNGQVSATGTWQLAGDNFTAMYTYPNGTVVNVTGTVNKSDYKIIANWNNSGGETGTLFVEKE